MVDVGDAEIIAARERYAKLLADGAGNLSDAMVEASGDRPGTDALVNIAVDASFQYFILWSQQCTEVRATAVSVP